MRDLPVGAQIPGSRFFRDYCKRCKTPMRVTEAMVRGNNFCDECAPHRPDDLSANLTPRQRASLHKTRS